MKAVFSIFTTVIVCTSTTVLVSACSSMSNRNALTDDMPHRIAVASYQVSQLGFGRNAEFGICLEPACPKRTPKTLAGETVRQVSLSSTEPSPTIAQPSGTDAISATSESQPKAESPQLTSKWHSEKINIRFAFGDAILSPEARIAIDKSLPLARRANRIVIQGRTDDTGPQTGNDKLALARAIATRNYIRSQIPDVDNVIEISAKGRCCFITENTTFAGRAANRRVEVVFNLRG